MSIVTNQVSVPFEEKPLPELVYFDRNGDTRLIVSSAHGQKHAFIVSSKAMTLVCDAWKRMLSRDGGFSEAVAVGADGIKDVSFPEDDAGALAILLDIAHLNFKSVPATVTLHCLWKLAVLTDKYGATKLVQPWIANWINSLRHTVGIRHCQEWLLISWEFGEEKVFEALAGLLAREAECANGILRSTLHDFALDPGDEHVLLPPGIIESITAVRERTIDRMLDLCYEYVDDYRARRRLLQPLDTVCLKSAGAKQCDAINYGSLHLALANMGFVDQRATSATVPWSVGHLASRLLSIEILAHPVPLPDPPFTHHDCNIQGKFRLAVWTVVDRMPSAVLEHHYVHMRRQRDILCCMV